MYNKKNLDSSNLEPLSCNEFAKFKTQLTFEHIKSYNRQDFIELFHKRLQSVSNIEIKGLSKFTHRDLIIGCNHFIDNLIMQYGINNIQIFEHDYSYYKKLHPNIQYTTIDSLTNKMPLLIAAPFPGHLNIHRQFSEIIKKCEDKNIDVYIDAAWLPSAFDVILDLSSSCIKQVAFSCSKAYNLSDNRIGVRYCIGKQNDSINHMNERNMISKVSYQIACAFLNKYEYDHLVTLYKNDYFEMCKSLKLRPSNIIHAVFSIDWKKLFGVKKVLRLL